MQKLGLDCPTSWLEYIQPLADFDYVLVEKCLKDEAYLNYFKKSPREKIINNRLMGEDKPRSLQDIKKIWDILGGKVIAPDWGNDHRMTIEGYKECCSLIPKENVIGVIQGNGLFEIDECVGTYGQVVAVGFDVGSVHEDDEVSKTYRRIRVVENLDSKRVHLLGMTNPGELLFYKQMPWVESINTGLPVLLGFKGMSLLEGKRVKDVSSYNYMDMDNPPYDEDIYDLIEGNVADLRCLLGYSYEGKE